MPKLSVKERFLSKIQRTHYCWLWTAGKNGDGYGNFWDGKACRGAHVVAYEFFIGDTGGFQVLHKCDNPGCVNPDHLFLGTHLINMQDKMTKGRGAVGERSGAHKLTNEDILFIRNSVLPIKDLSRKFEVSRVNISCIQTGRLWGHLPGKRRTPRPSCKLSIEQVKSILVDERRRCDIAREYGVTPPMISAIKQGRSWAKALSA